MTRNEKIYSNEKEWWTKINQENRKELVVKTFGKKEEWTSLQEVIVSLQ